MLGTALVGTAHTSNSDDENAMTAHASHSSGSQQAAPSSGETVTMTEQPVATIQVETHMRGIIEVAADQVIEFVQPLVGFEAHRRFVMFQTQEGPMYWLQAIDAVDVAKNFCVLAPFEAGLDPQMDIHQRDAEDISAERVDDIAVYTLLVLDPDPHQVRTNMRAHLSLWVDTVA